MFYLPLSLSFLFFYSSTILLFSFLKFFIPSFAILLRSIPFHYLVYSIYFSIHKKNRPHIDPTLNFFFLQHSFLNSEKKPPHFYCFSITTTFLLFSLHHHHISTVSLQHHHHHHHHHSSIVSLLHHHQHHHHPPAPPHFYCFHSSCCFVIWVWSFWPEVGLFGLCLASDLLKDKKAALLLPKKTANSSGTPLLIVSLH